MKGADKTDQDSKVGISNEDRRMNTDSDQSGSSPDNRDKLYYFNKILLSSVPVLFTL